LRVSESRVLRRTFGLKMKDAMEGWRKLCIEKLHGVYSLPNVIMMVTVMMKSRGMKRAGQVTSTAEKRNA
jgi:hypothetical protein